jgi:hypothetical protein
MDLDAAGRAYLRALANRVRDIAGDPAHAQARELWRRKNRLEKTRPLVLCSLPEEVWPEIIPPARLRLSDPMWRELEWHLLKLIHRAESIRDDEVITDRWHVPLRYRFTDWVEGRRRPYAGDGRRAEAFHPVVVEHADWKKVKAPELVEVDRAATARDMERVSDAVGDILNIVEGEPFSSGTDSSVKGWGLSGIDILCELRGLANVLTDFVDNPGFIDDAMAFLCDALGRYLGALEDNNLLRPNANAFIKCSNTPLGSNGLAITDDLPSEWVPGMRVRCGELWGYAMAQELAGVSPEMHERFVLSHQKALGARFGLFSYGCCEPNDRKWGAIFRAFPNLREVSVSHAADLEIAAQAIGDRYVFCWKPNSTILTFATERQIREQLEGGMRAARGCHLVLCLRDTLTLGGRPELAARWTRIAKELAAQGGEA